MTREDFIEQCYQALNSGQGSTDSNVERLDIDNYFPDCLAAAIENEFYKRYTLTDRGTDEGSYIVDADFLSVAELPVPDKCGNAIFDIDVLPLANANGVRSVTMLPSGDQAIRVRSLAGRAGMKDIPVADYIVSPNGVDVARMSPLTTMVSIEYVRHPRSYSDTDEIMAPSSAVQEAILATERHFAPQAMTVPDEKINLHKDAK